jgi:hypothetical protein
MNDDKFKLLFSQLDQRVIAVENQKKSFHEFKQKLESLERISENDESARHKLQALQCYQQSERFITLRKKAEKEILLLQKKYEQLQQVPEVTASAEPNSPAITVGKNAVPTVKLKSRLYI